VCDGLLLQFEVQQQQQMAGELLNLERRHQMRRLKRDVEIEAQRTELAEMQTEKLRGLLEHERVQRTNFEMEFCADLKAFKELLPLHQQRIEERLQDDRRLQKFDPDAVKNNT
ncbi:hypothetical protein Ciccas_007452, partial [Cichlidogyrus casuarinus]